MKSIQFWAPFLSALFAAQQAAALNTTTTLTEQTSNNTSASSSFQTLGNGDVAPGNVSKISLRKMLPSNFAGKLLAHWMPWWACTSGTSGSTCNGHHTTDVGTQVNVFYSTEDPVQIDKIIEDMISRGYDGVMVAQSNTVGLDQNSTLAMSLEMPKYPNFYFSVGENGLNKISGATNQLAQLQTDMAYANQHYFNLPNYLRKNGRPVVYIFDNASIDWSTASAAVAGNPLFVLNGPSHATSTQGGFYWFGGLPQNTDLSSSTVLANLDSFLSQVASKPTALFSGSFFKGFNDVYAPWGLGRKVDQACGLTFVNSVSAVENVLGSSSSGLDWIQAATWDDYEEGTEVETGVDNCGSVGAKLSGTVVQPQPSFSSVGSEQTVDHYEIYVSLDGENLMDAGSVATGGASFDLKSLNLAAGTYKIYVQMVGKSHILNHMSQAISFVVAAPAPSPSPSPTSTSSSTIVVSSPAAGATVSSPVSLVISTHESFTVARIQVWDAGVKIVDQAGSSVNTTLSMSTGVHTLTITAKDSSMVTRDSTTRSFTVGVPPKINVTSPAAGSTVSSPVQLNISTNETSFTVAKIQVWDAGVKIVDQNGSSVSSTLSMSSGAHTLTINVKDSSMTTRDSKTWSFSVK